MVDDDKKTRRRRLRHLVAASERTLRDLSYTMDDGMGELVRLAEEYACDFQVASWGRWRRQSGFWMRTARAWRRIVLVETNWKRCEVAWRR